MIDNIGFMIDGFSNSKEVSSDTMKKIIKMNRGVLLHSISTHFHGNNVDSMIERGYSDKEISQVFDTRSKIVRVARGKDVVTEEEMGDIREFNVRTIYTLLNGIIEKKEIPGNVLAHSFEIQQEEFMYIFKAYFERKSMADPATIDSISKANSQVIQKIMKSNI